MNDRELLELAAKAAGMRGIADYTLGAKGGFNGIYITKEDRVWNPLTDDGDALRLAVKLRLAIRVLERCVYVESDPETLLGQSSVSELEMHNNDPYAATRRAIVLTAAEIGKGVLPFPTVDEIKQFANVHD